MNQEKTCSACEVLERIMYKDFIVTDSKRVQYILKFWLKYLSSVAKKWHKNIKSFKNEDYDKMFHINKTTRNCFNAISKSSLTMREANMTRDKRFRPKWRYDNSTESLKE